MMEEDRAKGEVPLIDDAEKILVLNTRPYNLNSRLIFARLAN